MDESGAMLVLKLTLTEGRTAEQKAALLRRLSEAAARHLGVPLPAVRLVIYEVPRSHWGVGGVSLAAGQAEPAPAAPASEPTPGQGESDGR